jgi:hypothetical protein
MAEVVITEEAMIVSVTEGEKNETVITIPARPSIALSATGPQGPIGTGIPSGGTAGDLLVRTASGTSWTVDPVVDTLTVDITASGAVATGQMRWNDREHTLDVGMLRGVVNQVGQETMMTCLNTTASTIGNGKAVMFTGTDDATTHPTIGPMIADGSVPGKVFFGVTTEDIPAGEEGYVTIFGKVRDIDTSAYPEDAILWLDPNNPGEFVLTEPMAPALKIAAAAVIRSHPTDGILLVRADVGQNLSECHDVEAEAPLTEQYLGWNEDMQHWMPYNIPNAAPKSITISEPLVGDSFTLFRTSKATTLAGVTSLVAGENPAVGYQIRYAANRTASGTLAIVPAVANNTTVGAAATVQNMPIPSGSYVWLNVTTVSGFASEFNLSIAF